MAPEAPPSSPPGVVAPAPAPSEEKPLKELILETFFVHQYNQQVEPLLENKTITIKSDENTVVDINSKTLSDDWMKVTDKEGRVVGEYLFSFNKDSGRFQSVIPPLEKKGIYDVTIYRYKNNVLTVISEGSLFASESSATKIEQVRSVIYINYTIYAIILLILLILLLFIIKRRQKTQ